MTTTPALPVAEPRRTASTVALVGFLVLIPMAYGGFVLLPLDGIPLGALAWCVVGGLAVVWRGSLTATIGGSLAGIAIAVFVYAGASRLFTNTPWYLTPDQFALRLALTVAIAIATVAAGYLLISLLRGRSPLAGTTSRGITTILGIAILVVAGGTLFAERIQAIIPFGASQVTVVVEHDRMGFHRETTAPGPTYWTVRNVNLPAADIVVLRIGSDAELALRRTGEMGGTYEAGNQAFNWSGIPPAGTSSIRRGDLEPGRYLLLVVEPLPPQVEGQPDQGGADADRTLVDNLYLEFTITN